MFDRSSKEQIKTSTSLSVRFYKALSQNGEEIPFDKVTEKSLMN